MIQEHNGEYYIIEEAGGLFGDGVIKWFDTFNKAKEYMKNQVEAKLKKLNEKLSEIMKLEEK